MLRERKSTAGRRYPSSRSTISHYHVFIRITLFKSPVGSEASSSPAQPQFKAICREMVRSVKEECLSHIIGERFLCRAVAEFVEHYHRERNHQGRGNVLIFSSQLSERKLSCMSTARNGSECCSNTIIRRHSLCDHILTRFRHNFG